MTDPTAVSLKPSEAAVFAGATRIFSAYVAAGLVVDGNAEQMAEKAVDIAISMAGRIDELVQSDDELM